MTAPDGNVEWVAETSVRWAITEKLLDVVAQSDKLPESVTVDFGWIAPPPRRFVWVSDIDGPVNVPLAQGGRKQRDDEFTIPIQVRVAGEPNLRAAMRLVFEVCAAVEDALAEDPSLEDHPALVEAEVSHERMTGVSTRDGTVGFGEVEVTVKTRLQ